MKKILFLTVALAFSLTLNAQEKKHEKQENEGDSANYYAVIEFYKP